MATATGGYGDRWLRRQVATATGGYGDRWLQARIGSYPVAIGDYFTIRTCGGIQVPSSTDCSAQ